MQCFEAGKLLFLFTNKKGKERRMYFKKSSSKRDKNCKCQRKVTSVIAFHSLASYGYLVPWNYDAEIDPTTFNLLKLVKLHFQASTKG